VMSFFFGIYRLEIRMMTILALSCSAGYGVMLGLLGVFHPAELDMKLETLRWWILTIALLWFAVLSGHIGKQRKELFDSKLAMESMLEHRSWFEVDPWNEVKAVSSSLSDLLLGKEVGVLLVGVRQEGILLPQLWTQVSVGSSKGIEDSLDKVTHGTRVTSGG